MTSWLPQHPGLLPWALLINAGLSWYNTYNAYFSPAMIQQLYEGPNSSQVTPLSATFGDWTVLSGFVRFYAAYHISNPQVYALVFVSYCAICLHWLSETFVFKTTKLGLAMGLGLGIDVGMFVWIFWQWGYYVQS